MTREIVLPNQWKPRSYQLPLWQYLQGGGKRALAVWHRRAGKDDVALHWAAVAAMRRPAVYWHMLPQANQARRAIWSAVNPHTGLRRIDEAFPKELRKTTRENEMAIEFVNGSLWQVVGSDNFDALVGSPPAGIVFSEWALANPMAWAYLKPILDENGGWAAFITTPRGKNHTYNMLNTYRDDPEWYARVLPASESGRFTPDQLVKIRREYEDEYGKDAGGAQFEQEYECSFEAALPGAYYARELALAEKENRICRDVMIPGYPVYTSWDLGVGDHTAIWFFQSKGQEKRYIDFHMDNGVGIDHYVDVLRRKEREEGYNYSTCYLPHDGHNRDKVYAITPEAYLRGAGFKVSVGQRADPMVRIHATRQWLRACWFDQDKCFHGIEALKAYRRKWDEQRKVFVDRPEHDWASHPADSFGEGAVSHKETPMINIERRARTRA